MTLDCYFAQPACRDYVLLFRPARLERLRRLKQTGLTHDGPAGPCMRVPRWAGKSSMI